MAETPKKRKKTPLKSAPKTPTTVATTPRRSSRFLSSPISPNPIKPSKNITPRNTHPKSRKKLNTSNDNDDTFSFSPVSPDVSESKKRKTRSLMKPTRRVNYKKVSYDGGEFSVGDDVYVKRKEDDGNGDLSGDDDPEIEERRICFKAGRDIMIECDDCLGGFHLKCLKPPLRCVPDGEWICGYCESEKIGGKRCGTARTSEEAAFKRFVGRSD